MKRPPTPSNWQQLCESVLAEMDPNRLLERIAVARSAIVARIADGHEQSNGQVALRDALDRLDNLRRITERQNYRTKTG